MQQYLMAFGSILVLYISIINLSSFKFKAKDFLLMIAASEIITAILLNISEFLTVIPMLIISVIYIYINSKNIVRSVAIPIISLIIFILSDYLITNICIIIFDINSDIIRENIKIYLILISVDALVIFLISKFLGIIINKKGKVSRLELKGKLGLLIVISLVLTVVIFYANIILELNVGSGNKRAQINGILFFTYFILLMVIIYILVTSLAKEMDLKNKQIQFDSLQEYTNNLEKLYTEMRVFRHDYLNILSSMIGYIQNKDIEGLEKYFNDNILPLSKGMESNNFKIGIVKSIRIPEIKGIFSSKLIRAQELGIDVYIDIVQPIEKINIDIIDLSRVVGILLDNAIEAAEKCDKPSIEVSVIDRKKSIIILIMNSCLEELPIHKIFEKGFSTKGENRGLGLYNLKKIIEDYKNVQVETSIDQGKFKQLVEITNKEHMGDKSC
jgi:two-component system sensor histidine kinase AgrC